MFAAYLLFAVLVIAAVLPVYRQFGWESGLGSLVLLGGLSWWYLDSVSREKKKRQLEYGWLREYMPDRTHRKFSKRTFRRIRFVLKPDAEGRPEKVLLAQRAAWAKAKHAWWGLTIFHIVGVGLAFLIRAFAPEVGAMALLPLVWLPISWMMGWFMALDWWWDYLIVTNRRTILANIPSVWLPFAQPIILALDHNEVILVNQEGQGMGGMLGYGVIIVDSEGQADERFNRMEYVRHHHEVHGLLDRLKGGRRARRGEHAGDRTVVLRSDSSPRLVSPSHRHKYGRRRDR